MEDQDVLRAWAARQARLEAEKSEAAELARLLAKMGEATLAVCGAGEFEFRDEAAGRRLDTLLLRSERPELWDLYSKAMTRKVPRFRMKGE